MQHERRTHDKEVKRLMLLNLRQGGMLSKQMRDVQKELSRHAEKDTDMFIAMQAEHGKVKAEVAALKTHVGWMKTVGTFVATALGLGHIFK